MVYPLWRMVKYFFTGLNTELPYDPTTPFPGIYSREFEISVHRKMFIHMFLTLFIIAPKEKPPKCSSIDKM